MKAYLLPSFIRFLSVLFLLISETKAEPPPSISDLPSPPVPVNETQEVGTQTPMSSESQEKAPIFFTLGEQRLLRIDGLVRYSVGGTSIHAHSLENQILIKAVNLGLGDLWVWKSDGSTEHRSIRVQKDGGTEIKPALQRGLSSLQEVEVLISGSGAVLHGVINTFSEASRIAALLQGFPAEIHNEALLSATLLEKAIGRLQNWIHATKNDSKVTVEQSQGLVFVRGSIDRPVERMQIEEQLRGVFPLVQIELESLPDSAPTVHFRVFLLELKKSRFHTFGLGWPASQAAAFRVTTSAIQDQIGLDVALNTLEGEGSVRVLSNPELVVRAPGDAELFAGGEIPIRADSQFYSNVSWKSFGLSLKLKVASTTAKRVRLDIATEVSHLDPTISSEKIPGIQANRMKTQVDAQYGVPLFLSGLLQQDMHKAAQGLPLLRSIPILGSLFGSEDYRNERSELVAVLLPALTPPDAPMERFARLTPKGEAPPPRDWISSEEERKLKSSPNYPWNALNSKESP